MTLLSQFRVVIEERAFQVTLSQVGVIDINLFRVLTSAQGASASLGTGPQAVAVNLLQVLVSQAPHMTHKFSPHAKSFYLNSFSRPLPGGLVALSGFFQSVRPVLNQFIVNVDTTTAAFYPAVSLQDLAMQFINTRTPRDLHMRCQDSRELERLRRFLFKVAVRIDMPGKRRDAKRYITKLVPRAGYFTFEKGGTMITVKDHYAEAYNLALKDPELFGVQFGGDAVFPAELCIVVPGQRYKRKLDPEQTRKFLEASVRKPGLRLEEITTAVKGSVLEYRRSPYMLDAGVTVDPTPLEIQARELPPVPVAYGNNLTETPNGGAWNVMRKKFINPATIKAWGVVSFDHGRNAIQEVPQFVSKLFANMQNLEIVFTCPPPGHPDFVLDQGNQADVQGSLDRAGMKAVARLPKLQGVDKNGRPSQEMQKPDFMLVILPEHAPELRKATKWWGDVLRGIPTQCVRHGKYNNQKRQDQYCNNVALKINTKTRGVNFVPVSLMKNQLPDTMVVGCDVSHPGPGVRNRPSIASVVSSWHHTQSQYAVFLDCLAPRQEIIESLAPMMVEAVKFYAGRVGALPKTILLYRDGVSEGEYAQVEEGEIRELRKALANTFNTNFRLVFIVVGKRHHVRFFPKDASQGDHLGNCRPGLVVDKDIVHSSLPDFYLQSHGGLIGTSRPSHYVVLQNDAQWSADQLQSISYELCHVYAAATRSVSIPAPVYYADRACTRAAFQFAQDAGVPDYESSTNDDDSFDIEAWRRALKQSSIPHRMYFV
ncbi:uncharacterized protein PHACADRAFT_257103 [Phanerochaete carnosa HHB-10118-sp]|uniref:Piwi domain-containing protein n=1 Tax=Phanerochaete carnosa (strain HHB-10118-sp) TaxID=650164 RepID=K5V0Q0_PHACS|nr:uncharacterized protein PHACADRAFT_257103 [Phanerochaete carnosa HHB-10118-sp]EKM56056.1 hypothetical protein PHACADRAFT_257103 [Phanerochaete carnosa HHB-10118-sp]